MRLKELFDSIDFDSMVPFLTSYSNKKNRSQLGYCKMAYDELCQIKARHNDSIVCIHKQHDTSVIDLEGSNWEQSLGATLEIDHGVTASDAEIAARCLWGLTFYGYTSAKTDDIWASPRNVYSEKADAIWNKHYIKTAHLKVKELDGRKLPDAIPEWMLERYEKGLSYMNRTKRMRYYRQVRMLSYYQQKSQRYEFLDAMAEMAGEENRESIMRMLEIRRFCGDEFYSRSKTPDGHAAYLAELIGKYMRPEYEGKDKFIVVLSAPEDIIGRLKREQYIFSDMFECLSPNSEAKICYHTASGSDASVKMVIAACKDE